MQLEATPTPATTPSTTTAQARPPRVWPSAVLVVTFWTTTFLAYSLELTTFARFASRVAAAALFVLLFFAFWLLDLRTRLVDRLIWFAVVVGGAVVASYVSHPSQAGFGMLLASLPVVLTVSFVWWLASRRLSVAWQRLGLLAVVSLAWGFFALLRVEGLDGEQKADVRWRWTPTAEEQFLTEKSKAEAGAAPVAPVTLTPGDWPGFRGPDRDGEVRGVTVATDWDANPPRLLWRQRVGPAWSSMCIVGGRLFTQEQRGEQEAVVCYDADTGREVWAHHDPIRFSDPVAGAGPRATPTFADGRLFTLGATGTLNCLDAATGKRHWSCDITTASGAKVPQWGFSGSPLVVSGNVIVFASGEGDKNLLAFRAESGELAWSAAAGQGAYTSPQPAVLGGRPQVLMLSDRGVIAVDPSTGASLWEHAIPLPGAPRSVQPRAVNGKQVLVTSETDLGLALLDVTEEGGGWAAARRWTSTQFRPSFNDFVLHGGHVYGFDGALFACVDLDGGKRRWKEGRYGHGQVLLLADQGLLLVTTEKGEAVLLRADSRRREELGRFVAVTGKTWNHPVIVRGRLYVRSAEEMACYELAPVEARPPD